MNRADVVEAVGLLDDELIEETRRKRDSESIVRFRNLRRFGITPVAACVALIVGGLSVYAAVKLSGMWKVREGTSHSPNDIVYEYEMPENFKKVPLSEITGAVTRIPEGGPGENGEVLDSVIEFRPHEGGPCYGYKVPFDSEDEAVAFVGYRNLKIEPLKILNGTGEVTVIIEMENTKEPGTTDGDVTENEEGLEIGVIRIDAHNGKRYGGEIMATGVFVTSTAYIYTEESISTPGFAGAVLTGINEADYDMLHRDTENYVPLDVQSYELDKLMKGLETVEEFYIIEPGTDSTWESETVVENGREFQVITVCNKADNARGMTTDGQTLEFHDNYKKTAIIAENNVLYRLTIYFTSPYAASADTFLLKWMRSF